MKPIHGFLCLILWTCIHAMENGVAKVLVPCGSPSILAGCTRLPYVENADILDSSLKNNYTDGDLLHFTCRVGYVSSRRITYTCNGLRWIIRRQVKCSPKQCELPEDIANGYYVIVNGTDFVFGTVIKYSCNEGYVLVGRSDSRSCMSEGWSDRVPSCEVVKCLAEINKDDVLVSGLGDDNFVSYGHVLHFKCASPRLTLKGEPEVSCLSNGSWSSSFPTCGGTGHAIPSTKRPQTSFSCGPPPIIAGAVIKGLQKDRYSHNERVEYQCKAYHTLHDEKFVTCQYGKWLGAPLCLEPCVITVEEMERLRIQLKYGSQRKLYAKHGEPVQFKCSQKKTRETFREFCNNGVMNMPNCD